MIERFEKYNETNYNPENWGEQIGSSYNMSYKNHPFVGKKLKDLCVDYNKGLCRLRQDSLVKEVYRIKLFENGYTGIVRVGNRSLKFFSDSDENVKFFTTGNIYNYIAERNLFVTVDGNGDTTIHIWDTKTGELVKTIDYNP